MLILYRLLFLAILSIPSTTLTFGPACTRLQPVVARKGHFNAVTGQCSIGQPRHFRAPWAQHQGFRRTNTTRDIHKKSRFQELRHDHISQCGVRLMLCPFLALFVHRRQRNGDYEFIPVQDWARSRRTAIRFGILYTEKFEVGTRLLP